MSILTVDEVDVLVVWHVLGIHQILIIYWGKITLWDFESIAIPDLDAHLFYIGDDL